MFNINVGERKTVNGRQETVDGRQGGFILTSRKAKQLPGSSVVQQQSKHHTKTCNALRITYWVILGILGHPRCAISAISAIKNHIVCNSLSPLYRKLNPPIHNPKSKKYKEITLTSTSRKFGNFREVLSSRTTTCDA